MRRLLKKSELQKTDFTKVAQSYELDCTSLMSLFIQTTDDTSSSILMWRKAQTWGITLDSSNSISSHRKSMYYSLGLCLSPYKDRR